MTATTDRLEREAQRLNADGVTIPRLLGLFETVKKRPLLTVDFALAKTTLTSMADSITEKFFCTLQDNAEGASQPPKQRTLKFGLSYMAPYCAETNNTDILVVTDRMYLSPRECHRCIRGVPVSIDTSKAEIRHIRNTSKALHYTENDFLKAALIAMPIATVLAPFLSHEKSEIPIAVPHSHGVFLGMVTKNLPLNAECIVDHWKAERTFSKKYFKKSDKVTEDFFTLGAAVRFYDSISFRLFKSEHYFAHDALLPILQNRDQLVKMRNGFEIYAWGPIEKKIVPAKYRQDWKEVCDDVRTAVGELIGHPNRRNHSIYTLPLAA